MKTVVMIPTYNEKENIAPLINDILSRNDGVEILVVDDHSPDGTWKIVEDIAKRIPRVHLLDRTGQRGRGIAGREGFLHALGMGADNVIEMDADFSHHPRYIGDLLRAARDSDVVLGSRFCAGDGDRNRPWLRRKISQLAGAYSRVMLGHNVKDPTSGYRCFSRRALEGIDIGSTQATDPFIVSEILYRIVRKGFRVKEIPIVFEDRTKGSSKLGTRILLTNLMRIAGLRIKGWRP